MSFTALWLVLTSMSSEIIVSQTNKSTEEHGRNIFNERIYLHTDREIYIAGDYIFFKVYLYDEELKKLSDKSKITYIIICNSNNKEIIQQCLALSGGTGYGCLSLPDTLKTGTYQIFAYTNWMRNFGESAFFHKQLIIANRFDEELTDAFPEVKNVNDAGSRPEKNGCLTISTDRKSYLQREMVTLKLYLPMNSQANVSISVAEKPPEKYDNTTIMETFSSEDKNIPHSVTGNPGYRKICDYLDEDKGFIISGSVRNPVSASGIIVALSTPDSVPNLKYSVTNASGKFYFQLDDFLYNKDLYISIPDHSKAKESTLTIDDKYALYHMYNLTGSFISNQSKQFIKKSQTIADINKTYKNQFVKSEIDPNTRGIRRNVYYKTDYRVLLADYVPLNNFAEIVTETLPYIRLRKNVSTYEVEIVDSENKIFLKNPAIFLNGMLINNINYIVNFGSDKIRRIETICHRRVFGSMEFNGIMSVFTSPDVKNEIFFDQQSLHLLPVTLLNRSHYIIPEYSTHEKMVSHYPDFRQLLYWNPSVEIERGQPLSLEFYTSDDRGMYIINIEGIASDGTPISCNGYFDVR